MHRRPLEATDSVTVDSTRSTWEIFGGNCVCAKRVKTWFSRHSSQTLCDLPCERMRREQLFTHLSGADRQTPSPKRPAKEKISSKADLVNQWVVLRAFIGLCMKGSLHKHGQFKGRYLGDHSQKFWPWASMHNLWEAPLKSRSSSIIPLLIQPWREALWALELSGISGCFNLWLLPESYLLLSASPFQIYRLWFKTYKTVFVKSVCILHHFIEGTWAPIDWLSVDARG